MDEQTAGKRKLRLDMASYAAKTRRAAKAARLILRTKWWPRTTSTARLHSGILTRVLPQGRGFAVLLEENTWEWAWMSASNLRRRYTQERPKRAATARTKGKP